MELPDSLPAQVYLLAYDRERGRLAGRSWLGLALGGAALADLWLAGYLTDDGGRARPVPGRTPPADPALRLVWQRVAEVPPRKWVRWVKQRQIEETVRAQLATGWIRVEPAAHWWRRARVTVRDTRVLTRLGGRVNSALRGPTPVERLPARDAMLVALVGVAEMGTAISRQRRREYKRRLDEIVTRGGPPVTALRSALQQAKHAAAG